MKKIWELLYFMICLAVAMVGYSIHHSIFWSILDFIFTPVAIAKWLICQEINVSLIVKTFSFFWR